MATVSIYQFSEDDLSASGRAVGAITNNRFRIPVLKALYELGSPVFHSNNEIHEYLSTKINLSEPDLIRTGPNIEWQYRIKWALNQLKNAELVDKEPQKDLSWKLNG